MRSKIISMFLVAILFVGQSNLLALQFESTSTSGGSWTDDNTGMTYNSYGKKTYSFKKRTNQFTPWFKGRPPSIKAGCGGISLDGGFTAFLNLEEIGKQLEMAISSVGMGVIVVLVQTLPSVGKAFEDVQKLVRKIQQMLQNACQLTVAALSKNDTIASAKKGMQDEVDDFLGNNALANSMQGAATWLDDAMRAANCPDNDSNCYRNLNSKMFKAMGNDTVGKNIFNSVCTIQDSKACKKLDEKGGENTKIQKDSFTNFISDGKFKNFSLGFEDIDLSMMKLKYSIFGILAVEESVSLTSIADADGNINKEIGMKILASNDSLSPVALKLNWIKPKNTYKDILEFLTGGTDINATESRKLVIPANLNVVQAKFCPQSKKDSDKCESKLVSIQYLEETATSTDDIEFTWEGLYQNTYKTIMHHVNPNNPSPSTPIGVFVPQGSYYVKLIKEFSGAKNSLDIQYYADMLARTNVIYAIKYLILEIKQDAMEISMSDNEQNANAIGQYLDNVQNVVTELESQLVEYPGDVVYLDHLKNIFLELERRNRINRSDARK